MSMIEEATLEVWYLWLSYSVKKDMMYIVIYTRYLVTYATSVLLNIVA